MTAAWATKPPAPLLSNQTPLLEQATDGVDSVNRPARRRKASVLLPSAEQVQQAAAEEGRVAAVQEPAVGRTAEKIHAQVSSCSIAITCFETVLYTFECSKRDLTPQLHCNGAVAMMCLM